MSGKISSRVNNEFEKTACKCEVCGEEEAISNTVFGRLCIECLQQYYEKFAKKPNEPKEVTVILRDIPFIIPYQNYIKQTQVNFMLDQTIIEKELERIANINIKKPKYIT